MRFLPLSIVCCLLISALVAPLSIFAYTAPVPTFSPGQSPPPPQPGEGTLGGFQKSLALPGYNKESFDFQSLTGVMSGLTTMLLGCTITNSEGQIDSEACKKLPFRVGAIQASTVAITGIINTPPASGVQYLTDIGQKLQLVKPAYAQTGFGFAAIEPFQTIWRATRNLSYLFFVVAAVGMGVAIMLRTRISPQAVITIQSALPRIILALIFVTFSYAIVGLLIDLTYLAFGLLVFGLHTFGLAAVDPLARFQEYSTANFGSTSAFIFSRGITGGSDILRGINESAPGVADSLTVITEAAGAIAWIVPQITMPGIAAALIPLALGIVITILFFFFRVLFALARAYILLLLHLIFAPILILWSVVGGAGIWNGWLRGTLANLLVFPFVGTLIFLVALIIEATPDNMWAPPYVGGSQALIDGMIALGAIALLPTIPDLINQLLGIRGVQMGLPQVQQQIQQGLGNIQQTIARAAQQQQLPGTPGTPAPPCLSVNTLIDTPSGHILITQLTAGMKVWTTDFDGNKITTIISKVVRTPVSTNHRMLNLLLADGRELFVSPGHPTADGRIIEELSVGQLLDGARIIRKRLADYTLGATFDILPVGETGNYWANGILIGSTLVLEKNQAALST